MLVLTRRIGEAINIGDEIQITVLSVTGETIRLGIDAPQSVAVHRGEAYRSAQGLDQVEVKRAS
ncbi:carbon storage regulator CsrA [Pseudomonas sp. NPDC089569]|uniref:carbon storage regulator CsrA n=1 Tax=Pseudomonas sp. NPDC089569 TaxID=3390722 RepID=UPI003D009234